STFTGPAVYSDQEKFQKAKFSDISKSKAAYVAQANNGWIAMVQHYFVSAWVPPEGEVRHNEVLQVADNLYAVSSIEAAGTIAPGECQVLHSQSWVGRQDPDALQALAPGLNVVVDYGFLTIIAKPLPQLMTWLHGFLGNWGWTIV